MKKLSVKELQKSEYDKITNYFCKENINFFNSDVNRIQAYENDYCILFLDNIRFESEEHIANREYYIKRFDKENNKIEVLFYTINEEEAIKEFKSFFKGE
jgi:hypothetical protein